MTPLAAPGEASPPASSRSLLFRFDVYLPLAAKVAVPVIAVILLFVAAFLAIAVPSLQRELVNEYVAEAREVAMIVQDEYAALGGDRVALSAALRDQIRFDPSVRRINVYRIVSGSPVRWSTSTSPEPANAPDAYDVEPLVTGASLFRIKTVDGIQVLETVNPIAVDGSLVASVGVYSRFDAVAATTGAMTRLVVVMALLGAAFEAILVGLILQLVVLRPIGRLHRAALRVAAGDLSVRLPADNSLQPRDAIAGVAREFDHMILAVAAQRASAEVAAAELRAETLALQRANEDLERLYQQQSRFVSVVSHEFRTPLTGIQGFSEILRDEAVAPAEVREFAEDINREAKRLGRLIGDMLDLDRMRSGRMVLRPQPVDLDQLIREVVRDMATVTADHTIALRLDAAHASVRGDRDRLVQALTNLLSNAVKYSPHGGRIELATDVRDGAAHVAVRDGGVGIPADQLERVFEPYTRIDNDATRKVSGTGLGLPIVSEILRLHGGTVWAESVLGQGSTFHFTVPLARAEPPQEAAA